MAFWYVAPASTSLLLSAKGTTRAYTSQAFSSYLWGLPDSGRYSLIPRMAPVETVRLFLIRHPASEQEIAALGPIGAPSLTVTVTCPASATVVNMSFSSDSTATAGVASICL